MVTIGREGWAKISAANPGSPSRGSALVTVRYNGERVRGYVVGTKLIGGRVNYAIDVCAADKGYLKRGGYQFSVIIVDHDDLLVK